jgi:hypothetical protein
VQLNATTIITNRESRQTALRNQTVRSQGFGFFYNYCKFSLGFQTTLENAGRLCLRFTLLVGKVKVKVKVKLSLCMS